MNATMGKPTPPSIFCEDFALIPRGVHEDKPPVTFSRPVNLLSASSGEGAAATGKAAHVLVLNLDGQLYIRDLGGTALLQWNGNPTTQANLRHGDRVRLGKIEYEVNATRFATPRPDATTGPVAELVPAGGGIMKVKTPVSLIGSSEHAELRIGGENVPEALAMILRIGQGYWFWNLEPAFGCRVNGEMVVRVALGDGSVVSVAGQEFRFHLVPEGAPASQAKPTDQPGTKAPAPRSKRAPVAAAPTPPPAAPPPPRGVVKPPAAAPQPLVKPALAPKPAAAPAVVTATHAPPLTPATAPQSNASADEADVFKQWGPLAFAVAAADRPELQAGGSKSGSNVPAATPAPAAPARSGSGFFVKLLGLLVLLTLLTAGAYFAWKYLVHPRS